MLAAARAEKARGTDVATGMVVTHGRSETAALAEDIERLPPREFAAWRRSRYRAMGGQARR